MREIKFRGKVATTDEWVYGHYAFVDGYHVVYDNGNPYIIKLNTLGQSTGLKDKDGVEIYEGDIIRLTNHIDEVYEEIGKVVWEQDECNFVVQYKTINPISFEEFGTTRTIYLISNKTYNEDVKYDVIGNSYEHSHLLEAAE